MNINLKRIKHKLPENKDLIIFVRTSKLQDSVSLDVQAGMVALRWFEYTDYGLVSGAPPVEYGSVVPAPKDANHEYILRAVVDGTVMDDNDMWITVQDYLTEFDDVATTAFKYVAYGRKTPKPDEDIIAIVNDFGELIPKRGIATYTWRRLRNGTFDYHEVKYVAGYDPNNDLTDTNLVYVLICKVQGHTLLGNTLWIDAPTFDLIAGSV